MTAKTDKKLKRVVTPMFRVSYPALFQSRLNELSGKQEFGVVMLFDKKEDISALKALARKTVEEKWPDKETRPKNLRSPFRDGDEKYEETGREEYKGITFINAKSKMRPGIVDQEMNPILEADTLYAGCYARASVTCYAYDMKGNRGVAFSLQNIQKMKDGTPFSGKSKPEDDFESLDTDDDPLAESSEEKEDALFD